jgi:DNA-binding ferritin-like protein
LTSPTAPHEPVAALNQVLNELLDVAQDAKQARRKVVDDEALHDEFDRLFESVRRWADRLVERDLALGTSPLGSVPSTAARVPPNLWPGAPTDEEIRTTMVDYLNRLASHVGSALAEQDDEASRAVLADMRAELSTHIQALSEWTIGPSANR